MTSSSFEKRESPVISAVPSAATAGVLVTALAAAHGGWFRARVRGWEHEDHPGLVFSEASANASVQARRGGGLGWQPVEYVGFLSMGNPAWLTVEDGPQ